jgi:TPR repeat protein
LNEACKARLKKPGKNSMKRILFILITAVATSAVDPAWTDWRELWLPDRRARWESKSVAELRREAQAGNAVAMHSLFQRLYAEHNVRATEEANEWVKKAAAAGLPQAVIWVEITNNSDRPEEVKRRFAIYEKLAATGYPEAQVGLARLLTDGPLKPDLTRAIALTRAAHGQGSTTAYFELANMYARGIGEPRNAEETPTKLLLKAAEWENKSAMEAMVVRHHLGLGVEKDGLLQAAFYARIKAYGPAGPRFDEVAKSSSTETRALFDLFTRALLERRRTDLVKLAEMHEAGVQGKTNLVRAAALFTLADAPARADAVTRNLDDDQKKRVKEDIEWLSADPDR